MSAIKQENAKVVASNSKELEDVIVRAIKKVGGAKENDLCKYIPVDSGGYMHHFTLRKMKSENPKGLSVMIDEFIMTVTEPVTVTPKQRAARGSRKRKDQVSFTKQDLERLLHMARCAGDRELITKLTPKKSLASIKREIISVVRQGKINQDLWNYYVEIVNGCDFIANSVAMASNDQTMTSMVSSQWEKK